MEFLDEEAFDSDPDLDPDPPVGGGSVIVVAHSASPGWLPDARSVTITVPAEANSTDLLVVTGYVEVDVGADGALLDGWLPTAAVAYPSEWWHFTWVLPRTAVTSGLFDWGGETTWAAWRVDVLRGADLRAAPSISTDSGYGVDIAAPSVTAWEGGVLIWVAATDSSREGIAPPPGMELIGDLTPWSFAIVAAEEPGRDGPTGDRTGTWPESTGWTVTLLAIAPAPAGPRAWALSGGRPAAVTPRDAAGSPVALHMGVS